MENGTIPLHQINNRPEAVISRQALSPDKRQFLSAWRNGEEGETRLFDHFYGPACICHMDIVDSVMEFNQELNWLDRGRYDIRDHIILRSFDIELQHVNVLKLQIRQNGPVPHYFATDCDSRGLPGGKITAGFPLGQ